MLKPTVFHWGELEAQARAGLTDKAAAVSRLVQPHLPEGAGDFLAHQNLLVVGAQDDDGRLWASLFTGPRGFVTAPDDETVRVAARLAADDPAEPMTRRDGRLGLLAIDLATRIRLRMNGTSAPTPDGLRLTIEQSFPNCPKHIRKRTVAGPATGHGGGAEPARAAVLTTTMTDLVRRADTFFVATASDTGDPDVSHRGGNPGFAEVLSPARLRWPDYRGNNMLMTLGNMIENPHAALLVVDWATGATLQLTGRAEVLWPAGSRAVEFTVDEAVYRPSALPATWSEPALSRFNPPVGTR